MKTIYIILVISIFIISCDSYNDSDFKDTEDKENNCWLDLLEMRHCDKNIEFLIKYPDSEKFDSVLNLYFIFRDSLYSINKWSGADCFSNCMSIEIGLSDTALFEGRIVPLNLIRKKSYEFLTDFSDQSDKPEKREIVDFSGNKKLISLAYFEVSFVKDSCPYLKIIVKEVSRAINDYRDFLAMQWYKEDFNDLDSIKMNFIETKILNRMVFYRNDDFSIFTPSKFIEEPIIEL